MTEIISPPNLQETDSLLSALFEEVKEKERYLAGGTELTVGAAAVDQLFQSKVRFGNPRDRLIHLTEETFKESGAELKNIYRQQMSQQYDFYYMTVPVDLLPKPGAQFRRLTCQLDFGPKGSGEPIVQTIFPNQKWRDVMNFGVGMDIGLNGNLDWSAGVDSSVLTKIIEQLPGELKAQAANKNEFKAFVALPAFKYELGKTEITALGEGNSVCYWRIQDQEVQKIGTARFAIVFKVPKGMESITLRGIAWAEPNMNWLTADVRDVFDELAERFQTLVKRKDEAASQLARGASEEWTLALPQGATNS
jgi:hypothetical protein